MKCLCAWRGGGTLGGVRHRRARLCCCALCGRGCVRGVCRDGSGGVAPDALEIDRPINEPPTIEDMALGATPRRVSPMREAMRVVALLAPTIAEPLCRREARRVSGLSLRADRLAGERDGVRSGRAFRVGFGPGWKRSKK